MADGPDLAIFSPALVLLIELERDAEGRLEVHLHPGGQGYWVARMAHALGGRPVLCAPVGGEGGGVVTDLLRRERVALRSVPMKGDNGTYIHDRRDGERRIVLEAPPPALGRHVLDQLFSITLAAGLEAGVAVVVGTQASTVVPPETYERLVADLMQTGVRVVVDVAGELLRPALAGRPTMLKISHEELIADGWARDGSLAEVASSIAALQREGATDVVVSRAEEPAVASVGGELFEVVVPELRVVDHRGAGDSMTAGLTIGVIRDLPAQEMLALAAAAGALNVTRHGLASGHDETIAQLAQRVEIRRCASTTVGRNRA